MSESGAFYEESRKAIKLKLVKEMNLNSEAAWLLLFCSIKKSGG